MEDRWKKWVLPGAVAVILLVVAGVLRQGLGPGTGSGQPEPTGLHPWAQIGCYEIRLEPWAGQRREAGASGDSLSAPPLVMLLPDSVDRWGRILPSYRAVPLSGEARTGRHLRWMVRGDTLWLLWSEGDTRAGLALRPEEGASGPLVGRARALREVDSLDVTAPALAWRINCATRDREMDRPRFRR